MFNKIYRYGKIGNSKNSFTGSNKFGYNLFYKNCPYFLFSIFVKTQSTPNPHFLKFFPGKELCSDGETYDFSSLKEAMVSPLAKKIFDINGINRVFYGKDYISIGKKELVDWTEIKPLIVDVICDYFTKNLELFDEKPEAEDTKILDSDSETVALIKEIIATRVRPVVQEDGGDIQFINFDTDSGTVFLAMKGSCSGCPSSGVTLKGGIEKMLCHYVAEVKSVEAVED
jgi:Fe-S cluster biogenesis protein NfuA